MTSPIALKEHAAQREFRHLFDDPKVDVAGFFGGLQGGKTVAGADALHYGIYVLKWTVPQDVAGLVHPEAWILSRSYAQVRTAWDTFKWRHPECVYTASECKRLGLARDTLTHWLKPNVPGGLPIRLSLRTARDPEALRATQNLIAAWCDEIAHWPELAWTNLQGRSVVTHTRYIITTTPKGKNFLYRDVWVLRSNKPPEEEAASPGDPHIKAIRCRSIDNPWASPRRLDRMRKLFGANYADQELEGMFVDDSGLVYSFDRLKHMRTRPAADAFNRVVLGVDPGYDGNYAILVLARTAEGVWWVAEDWSRHHATTDKLQGVFADIVGRWEPSRIYVDIRRPTDISIVRGWHPGITHANRELFAEETRRTVMPMVRYCQGLLEQGRLMVHEDCEATAEGFENYHFKDKEEGKAQGDENPVKYKDDEMDALRYAICSEEHYMPLDTRPRYRRGPTQMPQHRPEPVKDVPEAERWLSSMDAAMDEAESKRLRSGRVRR